MNATNESTRLVRDRTFPVSPSVSLDAIADHIRFERATGSLTIHFGQGSVNAISFHEERRVEFDDVP